MTARSAVRTNTRAPATKGAVKPCAGSVDRQTSRPASSTSSSLSRVTTAAYRPSLPTPAAIWAPTSLRQISAPVAASREATTPAELATTTALPVTLTSSGKSTAPRFAVHACRTPSNPGLGVSSDGLGFSGPLEQATSNPAMTKPSINFMAADVKNSNFTFSLPTPHHPPINRNWHHLRQHGQQDFDWCFVGQLPKHSF